MLLQLHTQAQFNGNPNSDVANTLAETDTQRDRAVSNVGLRSARMARLGSVW